MGRGTKCANDWTPARVDLAKSLWADGWSAAEIAKRLGSVSRNAVIGKLNRLGFQRNTASGPKKPPRAPTQTRRYVRGGTPRLKVVGVAVVEETQARAARAIPFAEAFEPLPDTTPRPFVERGSSHCAWPVGGEGADTLSCCAPVHKRGWCATHFALGTQPMKPKQMAKEYVRRFAA